MSTSNDTSKSDSGTKDAGLTVPSLLQQGTQLTKVSKKSEKKVIFRIDPDEGQILYPSRKNGVVPIEAIKEIRTGLDAEYYCTQLKFNSGDTKDRWITIVYVLNATYKTLHLIAPTRDLFLLWESTIRKLYAIRIGLMRSLDNMHMQLRQTVWERQYWKGADRNGDRVLSFNELKDLCVRLNVHFPKGELERMFKEANTTSKATLNFEDFQRWVKLLKRRPELEALYAKVCAGRAFDFATFKQFMRDTQKSALSPADLKTMFEKYAGVQVTVSSPSVASASPASAAVAPTPTAASSLPNVTPVAASATPTRTPPSSTGPVPPPSALTGVPPTQPATPAAAVSPPTVASVLPAPPSTVPPSTAPSSTPPIPHDQPPPPVANTPSEPLPTPGPTHVMSLDNFTSFLMSQDNAPTVLEQPDMTQPISHYFISSSHNTYLVGNQLTGVSTIEGYIRALLCGCRSVELDIYDGDTEPVVYHGNTLTSQVSVREICQAIAKYGFTASQYPLFLSVEIHCGLAQQEQLVDIMSKAFGSALVKAPVEDHAKIEVLPSPEKLKGRVLVKTKNLYVAAELAAIQAQKKAAAAAAAKAAHLEADPSSSSESSDSESEAKAKAVIGEIGQEISHLKSKWRKLRGVPSPTGADGKPAKTKVPMSMALASLLVYTVGVKCRGIGKSEHYAPEHIFSLSENTTNKLIEQGAGMDDLIRHTQTHVVRIYPKGTRVNSTNYEPVRFWAAGAQLVAINWQTMDLGYRINQAMFMRNGPQGYALKPMALRDPNLVKLRKHTKHYFDVTIISAQQLPRPKDSSGKEYDDKSIVDPYIEVSLHIPAWSSSPFLPRNQSYEHSPPSDATATSATSARTISYSTGVIKDNGFNPQWQEELCLPFDCVGGMKELIFVEFNVRQDKKSDDEPLGSYVAPLSSLEHGFRHLPLHDAQLCPHLFSTLFVHLNIRDVD